MKVIITEEQYLQLLSESPADVAFIDENGNWGTLELEDEDALPFGFFKEEAFVGFNKFINPALTDEYSEYVENFGGTIYGQRYHSTIYMFNHFLNDKKGFPYRLNEFMERRNFNHPGRIWVNRKIISFYHVPSKSLYISLIDKLEKCINDTYGLNINLKDFKLDVGFDREKDINTLVTVDEFVGRRSKPTQDYDINQIHLMGAKEKRETPQMKAVRDYDEKLKAQKFEKTPEYLWNFEKNKGLAESITLLETVDSEIEKLKDYGYEVIDEYKVHNYTMFLLRNDDYDCYEIGLTSNGHDFTEFDNQQKKITTNKPDVIKNTFKLLMIKVNEWLNMYNIITIGSLNKQRTHKYHKLFSSVGFKTTNIESNEGDENFPDSWEFKITK